MDDGDNRLERCADDAGAVYLSLLRVCRDHLANGGGALSLLMGLGACLRRTLRAADRIEMPPEFAEFALDVGGAMGDWDPPETN
jgi:hypothetical protein